MKFYVSVGPPGDVLFAGGDSFFSGCTGLSLTKLKIVGETGSSGEAARVDKLVDIKDFVYGSFRGIVGIQARLTIFDVYLCLGQDALIHNIGSRADIDAMILMKSCERVVEIGGSRDFFGYGKFDGTVGVGGRGLAAGGVKLGAGGADSRGGGDDSGAQRNEDEGNEEVKDDDGTGGEDASVRVEVLLL